MRQDKVSLFSLYVVLFMTLTCLFNAGMVGPNPRQVKVVNLVDDEDKGVEEDKSADESVPRLHHTHQGKGRSASTNHLQELRALEAKVKSSVADMYEQGVRIHKLHKLLYPGQ